METFDDDGYYQKYTASNVKPWFTVWAQYESRAWGIYSNREQGKPHHIASAFSEELARRIVDEIAEEYEKIMGEK